MERQVASRMCARTTTTSPNLTFYTPKQKATAIKANAITKLARSSNNSDGATLYVTASPCIECAKLIIQAGIKRVIYGEQYRLTDGIDLLKRANIEVTYLNPDDYEYKQV